ncbi:hypothetical protein [Marinicrinis sediminis]|uniref:Uncharacterized protein n=1 Tax=Marinicrinis sediminis TaxID=1652465 RepID=A0ABW5R9S6_9BACL
MAYQKLNLNPYLNHKGISWTTPHREIAASLEHLGLSLPGEALPHDEEVILNDIPFQFPKTDEAFDHISCEGQEIRMDRVQGVRSLYILGCCSHGDYEEKGALVFADDAVESILFRLSYMARWHWDHRLTFDDQMGLHTAYHRSGHSRLDIGAGIWMNRIGMACDRPLQAIRLPDNPYMHIFAMTLETDS